MNLVNLHLVVISEFAKKYDFGLTEDETFKLLVKYDLKNNGTFSYVDFLRHFVLTSTAPDGGTGRTSQMLLRRSSSGPNVRLPISVRTSNRNRKTYVRTIASSVNKFAMRCLPGVLMVCLHGSDGFLKINYFWYSWLSLFQFGPVRRFTDKTDHDWWSLFYCRW